MPVAPSAAGAGARAWGAAGQIEESQGLLLLDRALKVVSSSGAGAALFDNAGGPAPVGRRLRDLIGSGRVRGSLPLPDTPTAPLTRTEALLRTPRGRMVSLDCTHIPDGWLVTCCDVTVDHLAELFAARLEPVRSLAAGLEALRDLLCVHFGLLRMEILRIPADALLPPPDAADDEAVVSLEDAEGVLATLIALTQGSAVAPEQLAAWTTALCPQIMPHLRRIEALDRLAAQRARLGGRVTTGPAERGGSLIAAILENLRDAVLAVDEEMTIVYANAAAGHLLQQEAADIIGTPVWDGAAQLWDILGPELFRCIRQREKQELEVCWPVGDRWFDARILATEAGASMFLLDVTDRRRAAEVRQESEARHRAVSALTTDLVICYRVNSEGILVREWTIGRAADVLGREVPDELRTIGLVLLAHPDDRLTATTFTRRLLANEDASTELRVETPDGGIRWMEISGRPEWDRVAHRVVRIICALRDITARKRTETALRESEERFALAVEGAAEGLWDWNMADRTVFRSEHLRTMLDVPPDEDIQRWEWWIQQIYPDDRRRYREALRRHRRSNQTRFACEYRVMHRRGGTRWVLDRAVSRRDADGQVVRIVGAVTDISDRKNMELQLKAANAAVEEKNHQIQVALDNISQGLTMFDSNNRLLLSNRRYAEMYRLDVTPGITLRALLEQSVAVGNHSPEDAEEIMRRRLEVAASGARGQIVHRLRNGTVIEVSSQPLPEGGSVATFTDITARERREQELRSARDAAEAANRAKSAFLANMSHELRTPLNAVIGFSEVMKEEMFGRLSEIYRSYAADIHFSGQHLLQLINDILDISKIEAGKAEVAEDIFDVAEVVAGAVALCREQAAAAGLVLRTRVSPSLPPFRGDERYIRQILINLLSNALKFTPSGGRVSVCACHAADGGISLLVADTGIGIPATLVHRVFEPFYQVQSDLARKFEGTGLGLSLVKGLTELHGGEVKAARRSRGGTVFEVRLPPFRLEPAPQPA